MERYIKVDPKTLEKYTELSEMLKYVNESREENPNPKILTDLRKLYEDDKPENGRIRFYNHAGIDERMLVDEFAIRLLVKSKNGLGTYDLFNLIDIGFPEELKHDSRKIIPSEIWNLTEAKVLKQNSDRRYVLSPEIKEQFK